MPTWGLILGTVAICGVVGFASLRAAFAATVAACVLLPGSLPLVNPFVSNAPVTRVVVVALGVRLLVDLRFGRLPARIFHWTSLHTAFAVFLGITYLTGIVLAGPLPRPDRMVTVALLLADQFLFLVVVTAALRAIGDLRWVLGCVSVVLLASCGIGIVEHLTKASWGHWLFSDQTLRAVAGNPLEERVGRVRVRAGAEYALQFAWVTAMLLPAMLAFLGLWSDRLRRWVPITVAGVGFVLLAEYWAYSRTALAAVGGLALITALAARHRRLITVTAIGTAAGALTFFALSSLQSGYFGLPSGYATVRAFRLPAIFAAVTDRPLTGLGLGGLTSVNVQSTDTSYVQVYADAGLLSLAALIVLLVVATRCCLPGLRSEEPAERLAAAAATAGCIAVIVGGFAFDAFRSLSSARPFWLLVAIGVVAAERAGEVLVAPWRPRVPVLIATAVGTGLAGLIVLLLTPVHYAQQYDFLTTPVVREAGLGDPVITGHTLVNTVCLVAEAVDRSTPGNVSCRDSNGASGLGELRIQAGSPDAVETALTGLRSTVGRTPLSTFEVDPSSAIESGRPVAAQWAPVWLPGIGVLLVLLLPTRGPASARRRSLAPGVRAV